jgi:hypothetical protein
VTQSCEHRALATSAGSGSLGGIIDHTVQLHHSFLHVWLCPYRTCHILYIAGITFRHQSVPNQGDATLSVRVQVAFEERGIVTFAQASLWPSSGRRDLHSG